MRPYSRHTLSLLLAASAPALAAAPPVRVAPLPFFKPTTPPEGAVAINDAGTIVVDGTIGGTYGLWRVSNGANTYLPGSAGCTAKGIDDAGDVLAQCISSGSVHTTSVLFQGTQAVPIAPPGAASTFATAISHAGRIAGTAIDAFGGMSIFTSGPEGYTSQPFSAADSVLVAGINDASQVVYTRSYQTFGGERQLAYLLQGRIATPIGPSGTHAHVFAVGINNTGTILGGFDGQFTFETSAFIQLGSSVQTFPAVEGKYAITGLAGINAGGDIAGSITPNVAGASSQGFVRKNDGTVYIFVGPQPGTSVRPAALNDSDAITGNVGAVNGGVQYVRPFASSCTPAGC